MKAGSLMAELVNSSPADALRVGHALTAMQGAEPFAGHENSRRGEVRQPSTSFDSVVARIRTRHPEASPVVIRARVHEAAELFHDARVSAFVPIFIERHVCTELRNGKDGQEARPLPKPASPPSLSLKRATAPGCRPVVHEYADPVEGRVSIQSVRRSR